MKKLVSMLLILAALMTVNVALAESCAAGQHDLYYVVEEEKGDSIGADESGFVVAHFHVYCRKCESVSRKCDYVGPCETSDVVQKANCERPEMTQYTFTMGVYDFDAKIYIYLPLVCEEETAPALGHIDGPAATCTTPQVCQRDGCGEILTPALNHTPGSSADCTSDQTCTRCGETLAYATGHNYKGMTNKVYKNLGVNHDVDGICPNCGAEIGCIEAHIYYTHVDSSEKCACGAIDPDYVAPIPDGLNPEDGYVYEGGVRSDFTGLYPYNGGLFYILNGLWQRGANGLTLIIDEFWFLANGQVQEHHGFAEYDGEWFYLDGEGKLDTAASALFQYDGERFLVAAGRLVSEHNGLAQVPSGEWYYVAEGRVLTEFSGEIEYDGKTFQIVNGKLVA